MDQKTGRSVSPHRQSSPDSSAFVGLGSNLGDRLDALRSALVALDALPTIDVDFNGGIASLYETSPIGVPDRQPDYLNSAARVYTALEPRCLLETILTVETALGRERRGPGVARVIDIDLLLLDGCVLDEKHLTVPHPRMHERRFVLEPLCEIAPEVIHPTLSASIGALAAKLRATPSVDRVSRVAGPQWHCAGAAIEEVESGGCANDR